MTGVAEHLRRRAEQCRRLARAVNSPRDIALLEGLARDYEAQARSFEALPPERRAG